MAVPGFLVKAVVKPRPKARRENEMIKIGNGLRKKKGGIRKRAKKREIKKIKPSLRKLIFLKGSKIEELVFSMVWLGGT